MTNDKENEIVHDYEKQPLKRILTKEEIPCNFMTHFLLIEIFN